MAKKIAADTQKIQMKRRFPRENGCHYCVLGLGLSLSSFESSG
jgi:hypothetical protein